jgi:excisionase family DNA binding protein
VRSKPLPGDPALAYCQVLWGWREIARYIRRGRATVIRWHKERAMPIAFLGSTVVIPKAALDLWLMQGQPQLRPVAPPGETEPAA